MSSSLESPIFTNLFLPLYHELVEDSSTLAASPNDSSSIFSLAYDPLVLNPVAPPSPKPPIGPDICHFTQVSVPPPYLTDYCCSFALATFYEPHTYREAHTEPFWQQAMSKELDVLHKNHTWDMIGLPPCQSIVGCRWVYKVKIKADGSVERYKACLVAKGFTQEYGIDYEETFALVDRLTSVRCLIAVTAIRHWPLYRMDVKNAFLNGDLPQEVYMQPPPGCTHSSHQVCHLYRAIYGHKQASRA